MKKQITTTVLSVILIIASGCHATAKSANPIVESLHGISVTANSLSFAVTSNGCTRKEHFGFIVQPATVPQLTIVRKRPDNCRRKRHVIELEYPLPMVGIDGKKAIAISNPLKAFYSQTFK
ncbi:MAG: hypothetical protein KZQ95_03980 [Candidatus Thiodiazotropha sp. (ex Epidulcina cf. delphinae)]|nr:hypothetical protein [Candidatus Thiodiazotropha sp. (ex Epidulcina cf. delphinae)]